MPNKIKVAVKEVEQFVSKVWGSVIFKMPGSRKSKKSSAPPTAPETAPVRQEPEPVLVGATEEEDPYQNQGQQDNNYGNNPSLAEPVTTQDESQQDSTEDPNYNATVGNQPQTVAPTRNVDPNYSLSPAQDGSNVLRDDVEEEQDYAPVNQVEVAPEANEVAQENPPPVQENRWQLDPNQPLSAQFDALRKQVEDDVFQFVQVVPEKEMQFWRECLTKASGLVNKKPANYEEAIQLLQDVQKQLDLERDQLKQQSSGPPKTGKKDRNRQDDPLYAQFEALRKTVEDDVFQFAQVLPEKEMQFWRECLVKASSLANKVPANYPEAIQLLQDVQNQLNLERGQLQQQSYDNVCQEFEKYCLADNTVAGGKAALKVAEDYVALTEKVKNKEIGPDAAVKDIVKLHRQLYKIVENKLDEYRGVIADYERLMPIVQRAISVPKKKEGSNDAPTEGQGNVQSFYTSVDNKLRKLPLIGKFYPKSAPNPPPPVESGPTLQDVAQFVKVGFRGGFLDSSLKEIKKNLAELERMAYEALNNMDVQAEMKAQSQRLPCNPDQLTKEHEPFASGGFGSAFHMNGPDGQNLVGKILKDSNNPDAIADLQHEAEIYAKLGPNPNIAACYGIQTLPNNETALIMEDLEGDDMQKTFNNLAKEYNKGSISREEYVAATQHMIKGILNGMAAFEAMGLVHLDLKGDNIKFDPKTNEAKIFDMGLVQKTGQLEGEKIPLKWLAPEVIGAGQVTEKADTFGVGQMIYQQIERSLVGTDPNAKWQVEEFKEEAPKKKPDTKNPKEMEVSVGKGMGFFPGKGAAPLGMYSLNETAQGHAKATQEGANPSHMPLEKNTGDQAKAGTYGVETAYVDFMNKLMHPDPNQRMTASEALRHPFMTQSLMSKEELDAVFAKSQSPDIPNPTPQQGGQQSTNVENAHQNVYAVHEHQDQENNPNDPLRGNQQQNDYASHSQQQTDTDSDGERESPYN
jgi:serine/threonine protein kinase